MKSTRRALLLLALLVAGNAGAAKPPICPGGRFIIRGNAIVTPNALVTSDAVLLQDKGISIASGCPGTRAKLKRLKTGTLVRARWRRCGQLRGAAKLKATIGAGACHDMNGVFRAKKAGVNTSFTAGLPGPSDFLNEGLVLPAGSYTLANPTEDPTIQLGAGAGGSMDAQPGQPMMVQIPFTAPSGNVVGAGIRFGDSGPIRVIPIPAAQGNTSGTLGFQFQLPASICNNLGAICHQIKCYEYAVTAAGTVSRANIQDVALACNNCDVPSCQDLLNSCRPMPCSEFLCADNRTCIPVDRVCNNRTDCPGGDDEDASRCSTPSACCTATRGCPGETGSSCTETCCCCPEGEKCCADLSGCCEDPGS